MARSISAPGHHQLAPAFGGVARECVRIARLRGGAHERVDIVVGIESRGFIFAGAVAHQLSAGFVPVRKLGKLPGKTIEVEYELEYGRDALAIHEDAIKAGQRVLAVDDLLATGGTMAATLRLVEQLGGLVVGVAFMIELAFLHGRQKLKNRPVHSLIVYD